MVTLYNISDNKKYKVIGVQSLTIEKTVSATQFSIPTQETPEIIQIAGAEREGSIQFILKDSDEDLSLGTNNEPVKTIEQQINYLDKYFISADIGKKYKLILEEFNNLEFEIVPTRLSFDFEPAVRRVQARITFLIGNKIV